MSIPVPNTTQIPHMIIREWMPRLKDTELRVLLVVADQTLGWIEDVETGRRKEKDWISHYQLRGKVKKKGNKVGGDRAVSKAIAELVDNLRIIEAMDEEGNLLDSPQKRMQNGGKIFYRLKLRSPDASLFDTPAKKTGVVGMVVGHIPNRVPPSKERPSNRRATKETLFTKGIHASSETDAPEVKIISIKITEIPEKISQRKKDHVAFMEFWYETVQKARHIRPVISGSDGKNLKRVLEAGVPESLLEQIALFFLEDFSFRKFSPTIQTFCSSGILNGLLNRTKNDPEFHRKLNQYVTRYMRGPNIIPSVFDTPEKADAIRSKPEIRTYGLLEFQAGVQQLSAKFAAPKTTYE